MLAQALVRKELQQHVTLDPVSDRGHVLGRYHVLQEEAYVLGSSDFASRCIALYQGLIVEKFKKPRDLPILKVDLCEDDAVKGHMSSVAAKLAMKFMWLSRASRPDITFAVNPSAKHITCLGLSVKLYSVKLYLSSTASLAHDVIASGRENCFSL